MNFLVSSLLNAVSGMGQGFAAFFDVWFLVLPPLLYGIFFILWKKYAQRKWTANIKFVLLEIIPPRDLEKSPQPMESIFAGLAGVIVTPTAIEEYVKGFLPTKFSLELVGTEGVVHFYIRTPVQFRNLIEAHFYSQYPDIEIIEVEDYVDNVPRTLPNNDWDLWGTDFEFTRDDLYPIRTYKYFEESVTGKMIDPVAGLIETMGKLGPGQHIWLQYITTPLNEPKAYKALEGTVDKFLGREKEEEMGPLRMFLVDIWDIISQIHTGILGNEPEFASHTKEKKDEQPLEFRLSPGEKDVLKALQANLAKQQYRVRMRMIYLGRREGFSKAFVSSFIGGIKQFADQNMNAFKPNDNSKTYANYFLTQERLRFRQRRLFRRYITRDNDPTDSMIILSAEEMATVFHLPDMSVIAPTLVRVSAKRGNAPANLPIQE